MILHSCGTHMLKCCLLHPETETRCMHYTRWTRRMAVRALRSHVHGAKFRDQSCSSHHERRREPIEHGPRGRSRSPWQI